LLTKYYKNDNVAEGLNRKCLQLKGLMYDQNNLKDQYITNLKFKVFMCD